MNFSKRSAIIFDLPTEKLHSKLSQKHGDDVSHIFSFISKFEYQKQVSMKEASGAIDNRGLNKQKTFRIYVNRLC
jgi:hypothetical protein